MLLTLWRAAADEDLLAEPRMRRVPKVKEPKHLPRAFTMDQLGDILTVCRRMEGHLGLIAASPWWTSLILTLFDTGARIKALRMTSSSDYNPADRSLLLRAELQKQGTDQLVWVSEQTATVIAEHYNPMRPLIWPWPYCQRELWIHFRRILQAAGLPVTRPGMNLFQKIRRTAISYVAQSDVRLAVAMAGHCREQLTWEHYIDRAIATPTRRAIDCLPRPTIMPQMSVGEPDQARGAMLKVLSQAREDRI